jgi:Protein of unknown function (DUF3347).
MKIKLFAYISLAALFIACNSTPKSKDYRMDSLHQAAIRDSSVAKNKNVKEISPTFQNVDAKTAGLFNAVIDNYLRVKDALANSNEGDAQKTGKELYEAISKIDKSTLPGEQRNIYAPEEDDLKENAEHIGKSKLDHQREHFSMLSQSIYVIVRSFGSSTPLYHLFCSKAGNGEGAMWLSKTIDSNNPYGKEADCTEVIEKIK